MYGGLYLELDLGLDLFSSTLHKDFGGIPFLEDAQGAHIAHHVLDGRIAQL